MELERDPPLVRFLSDPFTTRAYFQLVNTKPACKEVQNARKPAIHDPGMQQGQPLSCIFCSSIFTEETIVTPVYGFHVCSLTL
jgi:hypothetical protein